MRIYGLMSSHKAYLNVLKTPNINVLSWSNTTVAPASETQNRIKTILQDVGKHLLGVN